MATTTTPSPASHSPAIVHANQISIYFLLSDAAGQDQLLSVNQKIGLSLTWLLP
jgi:hypothetical protein